MSESDTEPTAFDEVLAEQPDTLLIDPPSSGRIEKMREVAEQTHAPESDWIPQAFRRDTIEETARVAVESHQQAMRKISEQAQQVRELEAALTAQVEMQSYEPSAVYDQFADEQLVYAAPPQFDPRQVAAMANQVVQEKLLTPQAAAIADEAERLAASQVPGFDRERVFDAISANPSLIASAAATGDPQQIAAALADVHQGTSVPPTADLMRTMKLQAQSAMGAGGHSLGMTDAEQRWSEIASADTAADELKRALRG